MDPVTHKTANDIWFEIVRLGVPGVCLTAVVWFVVRTIILKVEVDGPGFTMKAERQAVADMLSDLLIDIRGLTREEKDLFMRIRNRIGRVGKVTVGDLIEDFHDASDGHRMLRSLQCSHLIRSAKGGAWEKDSAIQVTVFGERLAKARPHLFSPGGQPLVTQ